MASVSKDSQFTPIPINTYQVLPVTSLWSSYPWIPTNPPVTLLNTTPTPKHSPQPAVLMPVAAKPQPSLAPIHSTPKPFTTPKVTTTLVPLNVGPIEYSPTTKSIPTTVNLMDKARVSKAKAAVRTHLIGEWVIRESSEPFSAAEEESSGQEKMDMSNDSLASDSTMPDDVKQWTVEDVCVFFEEVLGRDSYTPIIKEHLIDGFAFLLLKDEHLDKVFKMQLGPRLKLLNRIKKLREENLPS